MATLQRIRNHGVTLLIIVGLAMLAFILGDFLNSGSSFFNRSKEYVGEIAGHKVHYNDYEAAKEQLNEVYKLESGRSDLDEATMAQIRNQAWQMMLMRYSLQAEAEKIGMDVTADELSELCIGQNPHQIICQRPFFMDENRQFNREYLLNFLHSLETADEEMMQNSQFKQMQTYWMYWENAVRLTQLQEKYTGLVKNLIHANKIDAKYAYLAQQEKMTVEYAVQPYSTIADSTINVSQSDLKKIYNERKPLYKQKPSRSIEYVAFDVTPSQDDFEQAKRAMDNCREEFCTTTDIAGVVNTNSDIMYKGQNYSINNVPEKYKDFAFGANAHKDAVTDIIFQDNSYSMARIVECGFNAPDSVQLKVIVKEGETEQEAEWYDMAQLSKEITDQVVAHNNGETFTIKQNGNELTLQRVNATKSTPKVKLAIIEREVTPSSNTISVIYNNVKQFIANNTTEDLLRGTIAEQNMTLIPAYNLDKNAENINNLKSSRQIVRWAYEAEEGQISDVFECGDQFIVALLTAIDEEEYKPLNKVESEINIYAVNSKKAEKIMKELTNVSSVEDAAKTMNTTVHKAENVTLSAYHFGNEGFEPAVLGTAAALELNATSKAIEGKNGVYVIKTISKNQPENEMNEQNEIAQLNTRYSYSIPYQIINLVEENANVTDNRANFQ